MTSKLYLDDAYMRGCVSTVVRREKGKHGDILVLDTTCFYPEGGGQPCDTGTIAGHRVTHVCANDGEVLHHIEGRCTDKTVECKLDWDRRIDHMQQHTGQHIISYVIFRRFGAETESLHIGARHSTIDIPITKLTGDDVRMIEDAANTIIREDHPIHCYVARTVNIGKLRKAPTVESDVRIVEIEGIEKTPCGGTHCSSSAEVGLVHIPHWHKKGHSWRIEFVCGMRCLALLREHGAVIDAMSTRLDAPPSSLDERLGALKEEKETLYRRTQDLMEQRARLDLEKALHDAWDVDGVKVVSACYDEVERARELARLAVTTKRCVALAAACSSRGATLFFASSGDSGIDVRDAMNEALAPIEGKGGGGMHFATGHGPAGDAIPKALRRAWTVVVGER